MTGPFTLPTARRAGTAPAEVSVPYGDLIEGLAALGEAAHARLADVLLAAHVKVLHALTEDGDRHAELELPDGRPGTVPLRPVPASWRLLVRRVAEQAAAGEPGTAAGGGRVLFVPRTRGTAPSDEPGVTVTVDQGRLRLRAGADGPDAAGLGALAARYRPVLEAMAADPDGDARAARLPAAERDKLLHAWSRGPGAERAARGVDVLIRAQAARTPDAVAVRWAGGNLTYRQLVEQANRMAHQLSALGAGPGRLVGVCLRRGPELLPAVLGIWSTGAGYLPLGPELPAERLKLMTEAAGCELVVTSTEQLPALGAPAGARYLLTDRDRAAIEARPATAPPTPDDPGRLAYVIYTSGSTGVPKGVLVDHRGLANYLLWTAQAYAGRGTGGSAFFSSISFDLGMPSLLTPLLTGQSVHLLPDPIDLADLGDELAAGAPYSFLKMTPGHLDLLSLDLEPGAAHRLAGLVIAAGDAFTSELARRWIELAGPGGTALATEYGPTEITVGNSGQPIDEPPGSELIPLGSPIPNTTMYVLTDRLEPVPIGVPGEVFIGGAGVALGYLNQPRLTAERFLADPYGPPGARLYRTGDRARWTRDGSLEFLGRTDHQVKIRGHRVELGEIQARLREHPAVGEVVVIACGPAGRARSLAAFVVPAPGAVSEPEQLRAHAVARLPWYMVPAHFVTVDRLPLTRNGKVDRLVLLDLLPL
ncbi:amino acid adenylation domain-containing protein [Kitasatospora sp. NPDC006697]|uniref:amino acid adenylation domain-containing protein n=1 Tax=Kitasatospora sp. NPDC006697 TaxID=3364020 RepID=UPI00368869AB